jgi:GNAT superfamily N-acetyltransferase
MSLFDQFLKKKIRKTPLQKKGDIEHETNMQMKLISEENRILKIINLKEEKIILYRTLFELPEDDEETIWLRLKIITRKGLLHPEPRLYANVTYNPIKVIELADIDIIENMSARGYGSILLKALLEIAHDKGVERINGWISSVDIEHLERLKHFYIKHGFHIKIDDDYKNNKSNKIGELYWVNKKF